MDIREFIGRQRWVFAKTYAEKAPHEYIVRQKINGTDQEFDDFVTYIRQNGIPASFWRKEYIYLRVDGRLYWTMGNPVSETTVINRCSLADYDLVLMRKKNHGDDLQTK